ncbi:hypothetical protein AB0D30_16460 [Streptomyces sp. NPDC048409]|uniref:hypothetical protein n=1 Tax=Streptomyces sp. NPDC048409 TaxID=3154723 RepID=UPI00341E8100
MGWEEVLGRGGTRERSGGRRPVWSGGDLGAAVAVATAQLPAAALLTYIDRSGRDDYGAGNGGALGAAFLLFLAPFLLPLLGVAQAFLLALPSVVAARLAGLRLGGPSWPWYLAAPLVPAALWSALLASLGAWPFTEAFAVLAVLGVLPTLGVGWVRRRALRLSALWWRAAGGSFVLAVLTFVGGVLASEAGLVPRYEPPRLTTVQLTGVWRDGNGAELRLRADGSAEAVGLPTEPAAFTDDFSATEYVVCTGSGTWAPHRTWRDGVLVELDGGCGRDTQWSVGGSEDRPQLFVLFGDPDAGTLRILRRV